MCTVKKINGLIKSKFCTLRWHFVSIFFLSFVFNQWCTMLILNLAFGKRYKRLGSTVLSYSSSFLFHCSLSKIVMKLTVSVVILELYQVLWWFSSFIYCDGSNSYHRLILEYMKVLLFCFVCVCL